MSSNLLSEQRILGFDPRSLYAEGFALGEADLVVGGSTDQVIGRTAALSFMAFKDSEGKGLFTGVTVVAPPQSVWPKSDTDILSLVVEGAAALRREPLDNQEIEHIRKRLTIRRCAGLEAISLVAEVVAATRQCILIPMAHVYRDPDATEPMPRGRAAVILPEDVWVPHVAAWAPKCIEVVKETGSYLVFEVPELPPAGEAHRNRLNAVDGLYPAFVQLSGGTDPSLILNQNAYRWVALSASGRVDEALIEIAALEIEPELKVQLEIQVLSRGHNSERTRRALQDYVAGKPKMPPELAVRFGRIAQRVGDEDTAMRLIAKGLDAISSQSLLEATLTSCGTFENPALEERAYSRLGALFPASQELAAYRERLLLMLCTASEETHAKEMSSRIGFTDFEATIIDAFNSASTEKLQALIDASESKSAMERDMILLCCATYALSQDAAQDAINLAIDISNPGPFDRRACWLLVAAVKRMLLEEQLPSQGAEYYGIPIAYVRHYIARNPDDPHMRAAFTALFAVESSGSLGLPLIVARTMDLARHGIPIRNPGQEEKPEASTEELKDFLGRAEAWLSETGALDVGHTRMPLDVIGGDPRALLNAMVPMIRFFANSTRDGDLERAEHFSFISCTMAGHVPDTTVDINALRMVASRRIHEGRSQRARDIAEQILELAGASEVRQRLAWAAFADIYHRSHSPIDALVGLACAFELEQEVAAEDLWWETYTLFRIVRDIGLTPFAWELLRKLKELQPRLVESERNQARMESLELSLRVMDRDERDLTSLNLLVSDAERHCRSLLGDKDEILPAVALLAQAIGLLEQAGGPVTPGARDQLRAALGKLGAPQARYLQAMSSNQPTIDDAVHLYRRVELARNADDVPGDLMASELAARRVLRAVEGTLSAKEASVAIELLSDRALDPLEGARELDTEWPLRFLESIRPEDGAVLMLGLDADGMLVALTVNEDGTSVAKRGTVDKPFQRALADWSDRYPYRYGLIDRSEGNNEFFVSMQELDVSLPDARRIIVVGEPALQQIPLNLALLNGELAGNSCAIGYVPSLTWLDATKRRPRVTHQKRIAWISEPSVELTNSALAMVLSRTESTLQAHGFEVDTGGSIPANLAEVQLAVIAAHGSVASGGRFFHRVSDEGHLVVTPGALAHSLAGVEMTILFICSGGRTDRHPFVNTSVGLIKQLLSAGCRTVIASPWPLSPSVTGPWLESFMLAWDEGHTALDATFVANKAVDSHFGFVPQYSLAMTVYGDVLLRKA